MKKEIVAAALTGILGISGLAALGGLGAEEAVAGAVPTCDAGVVTLTKTDEDTGAALANATFEIPAVEGLYYLAGDSAARTVNDAEELRSSTESQFNQVFNEQFGALSDTEAGAALENVYVTNLGDHPGFPNDITGLSTSLSADARAEALQNWQKNAEIEGTDLNALITDLDERLAAVNAAVAANHGLSDATYGDAEVLADLTDAQTKLQAMKAHVDSMIATTDWDTFVSDYQFVTNLDNWKLGLEQEVSIRYIDFLNADTDKSTFDAAAATAADAIGATETIRVTTNANGEVQFSVFGVNNTYADRNTRGDNSCEQLTAALIESTAPDGYILDSTPQPYSVSSDGTGSVDVLNKEFTSDVPPTNFNSNAGI